MWSMCQNTAAYLVMGVLQNNQLQVQLVCLMSQLQLKKSKYSRGCVVLVYVCVRAYQHGVKKGWGGR